MDFQERLMRDLRRSRQAFWLAVTLLAVGIPISSVGAFAQGMHGPEGIMVLAYLILATAGFAALVGAAMAAVYRTDSPSAQKWTFLNAALLGVVVFIIVIF